MSTRRMDIVQVAKIIRKELKAKFPKTAFKVRCRRFSLGEAIDVIWTDGTALDKVTPILSNHERIHYDEHTGEILGGGNRYVHAHRTVSETIIRKEAKKLKKKFVEGTFGDWNTDPKLRDWVWRKIKKTDYY